MAFENLNSLETLSIQNNKLTRIPEEVMEPIIDTLRVVDIMGEIFVIILRCVFYFNYETFVAFYGSKQCYIDFLRLLATFFINSETRTVNLSTLFNPHLISRNMKLFD